MNVTYADVAGCDEAKKVMEFVEFWKEPDRFTKLGAKIPRALCCAAAGHGKNITSQGHGGEATCLLLHLRFGVVRCSWRRTFGCAIYSRKPDRTSPA